LIIRILNNKITIITKIKSQYIEKYFAVTNYFISFTKELITIKKQMSTPKYLTLTFGVFFTLSVSAQELKLSGTVLNRQKIHLEYVNVILMENDSILVAKTATNSQGAFNLKANKGNYLLVIEQFGKRLLNKDITLKGDMSLGELTIEDGVMLEGITISNRKKLVEQKVDRMVFNVQNSIASQGMSGLDALRNTPLVRVQNDNIAIVGKGNVTVMINDRMINLSGTELSNYLQSLRSDDIARIEVITTPPSKYEAQGNSGIINIILKRNPNLGWSGNVSGTYQRNSYNGFRTGATVNYQSNKISTSLKLRQYDYSYKVVGTRNLLGSNNSIYTAESRKDQAKAVGLNYSFDYKINNKQNVGFIYDFNSQKYTMDSYGSSRYEKLNMTDSTLTTFQKQIWKTPAHTLNAYYDIKLDTLGKKISFTGNLLSNIPDKGNDFNTLNNDSAKESIVRNNSKMNYSIYSGQIDLTLPFKWSTIETGVKYTLFDNNSNVGYYDRIGSNYIINPNNSNIFDYKEYNYAAYFSIQKDFNKKWSAKVGLRYEYTSLQGQTPGAVISNLKNEYGKLFPTAYVSYKANDSHSFSINYSRRIDRPDFQSLNPFRWYTNPYIYYTGTPTLQPSFNDNVEFSYAFKDKLTLGIYNQHSRNNTSSIARFIDGINSNTVENGYNQNRLGLNIGYYDKFLKIWESSISVNASYTQTSPTIAELERLKLYSLYYAVNNTVELNKDKTYFLLVNFSHSLPFTYANIKVEDQIDFSTGIRASFLDKKLNMSAIVSDLFKTLKNNGYSYNGGYRSEFKQYNDYRRFTFSVTYAFGNNKVKGADKSIPFEEQYRAN
jgi:hypothetical protein